MKNKLGDLNDHLMAQIERLGDEDIKGDDMKQEIDKSKAMTGIAGKIIDIGKLQFSAVKFVHENGAGIKSDLPETLSIGPRKDQS